MSLRKQAEQVAHQITAGMRAADGYQDHVNAAHAALVEAKKDGIRRFAYWRDGVQYVGTTGKTLHEALAEVDAEEAAL